MVHSLKRQPWNLHVLGMHLKMNEYALKQNLIHFQPKKSGINYVVTKL